MATSGTYCFYFEGKYFHYSRDAHCIFEFPGNLENIPEIPAAKSQKTVDILSLWLCLTNSCNLACRYCFNPPGPTQRGNDKAVFMTKEIAQKAVVMLGKLWKQGRKKKPAKIIFFGGEPLINYELMAHVVYFALEWGKRNRIPYTFSISTNATLLNNRITRLLLQENFMIQVSIDGPRDVHDRHRVYSSARGSYDSIIPKIIDLLSHPNVPVVARATVAKGTTDILNTLEFFKKLGFRTVTLKFASDNTLANAAVSSSEISALKDKADLLVKNILHARDGGLRVFPFEENLQLLKTGKRRRFICGAGSGAISVDCEGWLYPCHRFNGNTHYGIGHVTQPFDKSKSEKFAALTVEKIQECKSCWATWFCGGCCPAESYVHNKALGQPHQEWCEWKRFEAEISLKLAAALGFYGNHP